MERHRFVIQRLQDEVARILTFRMEQCETPTIFEAGKPEGELNDPAGLDFEATETGAVDFHWGSHSTFDRDHNAFAHSHGTQGGPRCIGFGTIGKRAGPHPGFNTRRDTGQLKLGAQFFGIGQITENT